MRIIQSCTLDPTDNFHTIDPISPGCEVLLPAAEDFPNVTQTLKVMPGAISPIIIKASNGGSIDRNPFQTLADGECITLRSDGGQTNNNGIGWLIISRAF